MKPLSDTWLTEGLMDFEYKKYVLLAYLKAVKAQFEARQLYPALSDLLLHYRNLRSLKDNQQLLREQFPKQISKEDFQKLKLTYEQIVEDDELMALIEQLVHYAMPRFKDLIENGKELYDFVEENVTVEPIGIEPLKPEAGYLFVNEYKSVETKIYCYQITLFESAEERFRGINTTFLESARKRLSQTYEQIKLELVRKRKDLPNPGAYLIDVRIPCPLEETAFPIAKRRFVRQISGSL